MTLWDQAHAQWVATGGLALLHAKHFYDHWKNTLRLKGLLEMNPMQLIPAALTLGEDAIKLTKDLTTGDKASAIADTLDALPALATITGKPLNDIQSVITADNLGAAWDMGIATERIIVLIEAALAHKAAA